MLQRSKSEGEGMSHPLPWKLERDGMIKKVIVNPVFYLKRGSSKDLNPSIFRQTAVTSRLVMDALRPSGGQ